MANGDEVRLASHRQLYALNIAGRLALIPDSEPLTYTGAYAAVAQSIAEQGLINTKSGATE